MKYLLPFILAASLAVCGCSVSGSVGNPPADTADKTADSTAKPAADTKTADASAPAADAAKTAADAGKTFSNIVVTNTKDGKTSMDALPKDTDTMYFYYNFNLPVGSKIKCSLSLVKADNKDDAKYEGEIKNVEIPVDKVASDGDFSVTKPSVGWPAGAYKMDLYADGKLSDTTEFKVSG